MNLGEESLGHSPYGDSRNMDFTDSRTSTGPTWDEPSPPAYTSG